MVTGSEPDCEDVDECDITGSCHEDANCANNVGSYECTCKEGYSGDGSFCADINECTTDDGLRALIHNCDPDAVCTNTDASYTCTCPDVSFQSNQITFIWYKV